MNYHAHFTEAYICKVGQRINIKELVDQIPDLDLRNSKAKALNRYTRQQERQQNSRQAAQSNKSLVGAEHQGEEGCRDVRSWQYQYQVTTIYVKKQKIVSTPEA